MGWVSFQEDNKNAKEKSIRKEKTVKSENLSYEFKGKPLTPEIAKMILIRSNNAHPIRNSRYVNSDVSFRTLDKYPPNDIWVHWLGKSICI